MTWARRNAHMLVFVAYAAIAILTVWLTDTERDVERIKRTVIERQVTGCLKKNERIACSILARRIEPHLERPERGPRGYRGERGPRGYPGPAGQAGLRGPRTRGERGARGSRGVRGRSGDRGPRGLRGARGLRGPRGPRGGRGSRGARGSVVRPRRVGIVGLRLGPKTGHGPKVKRGKGRGR